MPLPKLSILAFCIAIAACSRHADTDYAKELARLTATIAQLGTPAGKDAALQLVYYRYQLASLSGDYADFKAVEACIAAALQGYGPADDLHYFSAQLNFKLHRLRAAQADIAGMPMAAESPSLRALNADIALQQGRYAEALQAYEALVAAQPTWDALSRLAYYKLKTGQPEEADALYRQAADMIPAKEMRAYAWVELQRGLIDLEYGRPAEALEHYRLANRAWSGYWLIEEHIAEVLDLLGRDNDAIKLYRKIIERTRNPEFMTALASILATSEPATAAALHAEAGIRYQQQFALYPEAVSGHLIEYLLQRQDIDPRLREYAEQNHSLRPNAEAKLLLARTHLKLGNTVAARTLLNEILQTPWHTPALAALAAELSAGRTEGATRKNLNAL